MLLNSLVWNGANGGHSNGVWSKTEGWFSQVAASWDRGKRRAEGDKEQIYPYRCCTNYLCPYTATVPAFSKQHITCWFSIQFTDKGWQLGFEKNPTVKIELIYTRDKNLQNSHFLKRCTKASPIADVQTHTNCMCNCRQQSVCTKVGHSQHQNKCPVCTAQWRQVQVWGQRDTAWHRFCSKMWQNWL